MNKYELITIPNNMDMANPYGLDDLKENALSKVQFEPNMTLTKGSWTFDDVEKAYWLCPQNTPKNDGKLGSILITDRTIPIEAEDEIEVEFEIKCIGDATGQAVGLRIDILSPTLSLIDALKYETKEFMTEEYEFIKMKKTIPPTLTNAKYFSIVWGAFFSPINNDYSIKIRNIKVSIKRNNAQLGVIALPTIKTDVTPATDITLFTNDLNKVYKNREGQVSVFFSTSRVETPVTGFKLLFTLPDKFRPIKPFIAFCRNQNNMVIPLVVSNTGEVTTRIPASITDSLSFGGHFVFYVD